MSKNKFVPLDEITQIHEGEKAMTTEELELAAAALINQDKPMTAEERSAKYKFIPTRVETKTGTWELIDGYKADDTLVGFRAKEVHKCGPLDCTAPAIVLTVEEWQTVCEQLDEVVRMMKI